MGKLANLSGKCGVKTQHCRKANEATKQKVVIALTMKDWCKVSHRKKSSCLFFLSMPMDSEIFMLWSTIIPYSGQKVGTLEACGGVEQTCCWLMFSGHI